LTGNNYNIRLISMVVLIAAVSAIGGVSFWKLNQARNQSPVSSLLVLPDTRVIADFRLTDHHSQPFSLAGLRGKWSMLFFGFTNCPDVCPGTLFELQKVNEILGQRLEAETDRPQILFISVDPERDTPAKLEQYLTYFPGAPQYDVAHSASILLTDPEGRLYGAFPPPHDAEKIVADLLAIIEG